MKEVVFNLSHDEDVAGTLERVRAFEAKWEAELAENRGKRTADEAWIESQLEEERAYRARVSGRATAEGGRGEEGRKKGAGYLEEERSEVAEAKATAAAEASAVETVIAELQASAEPAAFIVNNRQREQREAAKRKALRELTEAEERPAKVPRRSVASAVGRAELVEAGVPYVYAPPAIPLNGPGPPDISQLHHLGYLAAVRAADHV